MQEVEDVLRVVAQRGGLFLNERIVRVGVDRRGQQAGFGDVPGLQRRRGRGGRHGAGVEHGVGVRAASIEYGVVRPALSVGKFTVTATLSRS